MLLDCFLIGLIIGVVCTAYLVVVRVEKEQEVPKFFLSLQLNHDTTVAKPSFVVQGNHLASQDEYPNSPTRYTSLQILAVKNNSDSILPFLPKGDCLPGIEWVRLNNVSYKQTTWKLKDSEGKPSDIYFVFEPATPENSHQPYKFYNVNFFSETDVDHTDYLALANAVTALKEKNEAALNKKTEAASLSNKPSVFDSFIEYDEITLNLGCIGVTLVFILFTVGYIKTKLTNRKD